MPADIATDTCPCGSGRAMRACHGAVTAAGAVRGRRLRLAKRDVACAFQAADGRRAREPDVWGGGAPPAALDLEGGQAVFVNRQLFTKRDCRTVGEFLRFYLAHRLPPAWCASLEAAGGAEPMLRLARDLYELEHAGVLPRLVLKQLQQTRRAAQVEQKLSFAATLLRAGFDLAPDLGRARYPGSDQSYGLHAIGTGEPGQLASRLAGAFGPENTNLLLWARLPTASDLELAASAAIANLKDLVRRRRWEAALVIFIGEADWSEAHLLLPATDGLARGEVRSRLVAPSADLRRRRPALHALLDWQARAKPPFDLPLVAEPSPEAMG